MGSSNWLSSSRKKQLNCCFGCCDIHMNMNKFFFLPFHFELSHFWSVNQSSLICSDSNWISYHEIEYLSVPTVQYTLFSLFCFICIFFIIPSIVWNCVRWAATPHFCDGCDAKYNDHHHHQQQQPQKRERTTIKNVANQLMRLLMTFSIGLYTAAIAIVWTTWWIITNACLIISEA